MSQVTKYLKDYQPPAYLVETIDLIFELGEEYSTVKSSMQIRANGHQGDKPLVLTGEAIELISVALNGQLLAPQDYQLTELSLTLPKVGSDCQIDIEVRSKPQDNTSLMGLYKSSGNFCTQCEPEGFRKITYYIDRPDNLAIFTVTIVADKAKYPILLSNGNSIDSGDAKSGKHWVKWHDPHKKSPHLFALVAGTFDVLDDTFTTMSGREVKLRLFVEPGNLDRCPHAMESLKWSMSWDEKVYGREYDLDLFMTVAVGDFNMGAMENKGLNIFNTKCILANQKTATDADFLTVTRVVGHEYFHNWSGNRVGCRDWFQISLKEGFTVFRDQCFTGDMSSTPVKRVEDVNLLRAVQFKEDAGPMSHPIRPASYIEINNFYTVTVYEKGAEVIRMMYTLLGPEKFRQATDLYFSRFDGQSVTTDDFVDCMQEASGIDLSHFRLWYSQSGTPDLIVTDEYDAKTNSYSLHVKQHTKPTADQQDKKALHIPLRIGLLDAEGKEILLKLKGEMRRGDVVCVLNVTKAEQTFVFVNITAPPTPSLLRGFSAPVNLKYDYTDEQLKLLLTHDNDSFARWEAGQLLAHRNLEQLIIAVKNKQSLHLDNDFVEVMRGILRDNDPDKALLALLLTLPSEAYLADKMNRIDPLAIHAAREYMRSILAENLRQDFLDCYYNNLQPGDYNLSNQSVGRRTLKNTCLAYLMLLKDEEVISLTEQQYQSASNMTDQFASVCAFADCDIEKRKIILDDFHQQFKDDALVLDKWFMVQATSVLPNTFDQVQQLTEHKDFNIKNPNKVRSLIGAFSKNNPGQFHAHDGAPYRFLADKVMATDRVNPQMASRMVEPLTHWKRFVEPHSSQMREQLLRVSTAELSSDTYEIVTKALK